MFFIFFFFFCFFFRLKRFKVGMVGMEPDKVVSSSCDTMKTAVQTVAVKLFSLLYTCNIRQNECSHLFSQGVPDMVALIEHHAYLFLVIAEVGPIMTL